MARGWGLCAVATPECIFSWTLWERILPISLSIQHHYSPLPTSPLPPTGLLFPLPLSMWPGVWEDWDEGLRDKHWLLHAHPVLQPEELTNALEISNIVFTSLFALEMLLKLLVYGPFGYIKNPYNIFDGVIVVIRYDCPSAASCLSNVLGVAWGEGPHSLFLWGGGIWNQAPLTHRLYTPPAEDSPYPQRCAPPSP